MVTCLGHSVPELADAAAKQAEEIAYFYNHHFTSDAQERLAEKLRQVSNRQTETSQPDGSADAIDPPTIATLMPFTLRIIARAACSDTYGYLKSPHQQLPITSRRSRR